MDNTSSTSNHATDGSGDANSNAATGSQHNEGNPIQHANATQNTLNSEAFASPPARVVGPFASMVDAFISSFRQASQNNNQGQNARPQRQAQAVPPPAEPLVSSSTSTASTTEEEPASQSSSETQQAPNTVEAEAEAPSSAQPGPSPPPSASNNETNTEAAANNGTSDVPRTLFFRMPFPTVNGQSATLAFSPGPIPIPPHQPEPRPPFGPERPPNLGAERGNGLASGFHLPSNPTYVPLGASPLPFSFIFDAQTNTAWPIAQISTGPPGAMPSNDDEPGFAAGPPFHIGLNISFGPPPQAEVPDPERAERFVDSLERADAELRERMAQLGMGAIGDYGGRQDNEGGEGALGCGICLDEYPSEDRPEWIGGQASKDEEVVAVPCAGHHTLHRRCLYEWLAKTPPSEWTCPFCRAGLDRTKVESSAANSNRNSDAVKKAEQEAKARSLREEVRLREKARGWRCDSPACLLRYPHKDGSHPQSDELVPLLPCRHQLHLDCLCTSMRLEQLDAFESDCEEEDDDDDQTEDDRVAAPATNSPASGLLIDDSGAKDTVGKWVTCPTCRLEAWAELPMKKKKRAAKRSDITKAAVIDLSEVQSTEPKDSISSKEIFATPTYGVREKARMHDMERSAQVEDVQEDSDEAVETILL